MDQSSFVLGFICLLIVILSSSDNSGALPQGFNLYHNSNSPVANFPSRSEVSVTFYKTVSAAEWEAYNFNRNRKEVLSRPRPQLSPVSFRHNPVVPISHYSYQIQHPPRWNHNHNISRAPVFLLQQQQQQQYKTSTSTARSIYNKVKSPSGFHELQTPNVASYTQPHIKFHFNFPNGTTTPIVVRPRPASVPVIDNYNPYDESPIHFPDSPEIKIRFTPTPKSTTPTTTQYFSESSTPKTKNVVETTVPLEDEFISWVNSVQELEKKNSTEDSMGSLSDSDADWDSA